jgi:hypothetical protein
MPSINPTGTSAVTGTNNFTLFNTASFNTGPYEIPFSSDLQTFIANDINTSLFGVPVTTNLADYRGNAMAAASQNSALSLYLSLGYGLLSVSYAINGVPSTTLTLDSWAERIRGGLNMPDAQKPSVAQIKDFLYKKMLEDIATATGTQLNTDHTAIIGGDYSILTDIDVTMDSTKNPYMSLINRFLTSYQAPAMGVNNFNRASDFITKFHTFITTPPATIQTATAANSPVYVDPTAGANPFLNMLSYEAYYNSAVPNPTPAGFKIYMNEFYQSQIDKKGYFSPAGDFNAFVGAIVTSNNTGTSSVSETHASSVLILNRIIALLISMISTLQSVGVAQANNLTYLTKFQNAYTALLQQVPTFLADGKAPIGTSGGGSTQAQSARDQLNSSFNGILSDNLRSLRDVQSNNAKTVQSNINTTNDAVNQQTDMATTFLQQLSQLLGAIFR